MTHEDFKYYAFISYNYKDIKWGKRLQRKLEGYRMPATLCSEYGWERKPIKPVFFAPTDIQPGGLTSELQGRLKMSRNLIVICSPNSAKSQWVGEEIKYFYSLGRPDNIHFFIVDGIPNSGNHDTECYNSVISTLGLPEILGANIHEKISRWSWVNRERAYVQLITKLLGVEFDSIWQRHKRIMMEKVTKWSIGIIIVIATLFCVWIKNQPVDVTMHLNEVSVHNDNLPPLQDAIVNLTLDNETKTDTIHTINAEALFANIPHSAIGKEVHVTVTCKDWLSIDTMLVLTKNARLNIARDSMTYGDIQFQLWNVCLEKSYPNTKVLINGHETITNEDGRIRYFMPLAEQNCFYIIKAPVTLENDTLRVPTTQNTVVIVN